MDADIALATLTSLLDLDEFEVVESTSNRREKLRRFTLAPQTTVGLCPHCHGVTDERHACHDRRIADLPISGQRVELIARLWQFHCPACDQFFTRVSRRWPRDPMPPNGCWRDWLNWPATATSPPPRVSCASRKRRRRDGTTPIWSESKRSRRRTFSR